MLNGLDLFSGIGGITYALKEWVIPVAYCENERYAIGVLLSRMQKGELPFAPIWDDVRTLKGARFRGLVDILYGGFPCQDISVAGTGKGLGGERSGLFFEILRLIDEIRPTLIFLENVPAIRTRGADKVIGELAGLRYDARWITLSAAEIGANHKRERWWLLAHTMRGQQWRKEWESKVEAYALANSENIRGIKESDNKSVIGTGKTMADAQGVGCQQGAADNRTDEEKVGGSGVDFCGNGESDSAWWAIEPDVGRVAYGIPNRVDRIKCLGNAVVPGQAKEAFMRLMGIKKYL